MEYIDGDKFARLADHWVCECATLEITGSNNIMYCPTHQARAAFKYAREVVKRKLVLITHNSDHPVNSDLYNEKPPNILYWFAQNVVIERPDLVPIPIGLERPHKGMSWDTTVIDRVREEKHEVLDKAFLCMNPNTNPSMRNRAIGELREKPWVTYIDGSTHPLSFEQHCRELKRHRFVICPPGNGVDCIRVWESLYLDGATPIVLRGHGYDTFDLPMVQVDSWDNVDFIMTHPHPPALNKHLCAEMDMNYWARRIKEAAHACS